jgi:hypothetical protein
MQIPRQSPAALAVALLLAASAGVLAGPASGTPANSAGHSRQQQRQLDQACRETVASVQQTVKAQGESVGAIHSHLQVVTPGRLTGQIEFKLSGAQASAAGPRARVAAMSFGCGQASARIAGPGTGGSRVVSTLHRTFKKPGRYELSFTLNNTGRQLLAQLAAADRTYFKQHPQGQHPPSLAYAVALMYTPGL